MKPIENNFLIYRYKNYLNSQISKMLQIIILYSRQVQKKKKKEAKI